jgi:hypothetical protein
MFLPVARRAFQLLCHVPHALRNPIPWHDPHHIRTAKLKKLLQSKHLLISAYYTPTITQTVHQTIALQRKAMRSLSRIAKIGNRKLTFGKFPNPAGNEKGSRSRRRMPERAIFRREAIYEALPPETKAE